MVSTHISKWQATIYTSCTTVFESKWKITVSLSAIRKALDKGIGLEADVYRQHEILCELHSGKFASQRAVTGEAREALRKKAVYARTQDVSFFYVL
jgi:hypothetical protein